MKEISSAERYLSRGRKLMSGKNDQPHERQVQNVKEDLDVSFHHDSRALQFLTNANHRHGMRSRVDLWTIRVFIMVSD